MAGSVIAERRPKPLPVGELAPLMRLLSDPIRLEILLLLSRGECCVCDLVEAIGKSQPLLSHHLGALRKRGLVRDRKAGRWTYYRLASDTFEPVAAFLDRLRQPAAFRSRENCDSEARDRQESAALTRARKRASSKC